MPYKPTSMVLFLSICSLNKASGGEHEYDESEAVTSVLPPRLGNQLMDRREQVRRLVKSTAEVGWQGVPLANLEFNRDLAQGRDFGGHRTASYLPALDRYQGRFFQALGTEGKNDLGGSPHHVLLLSGLYGLLRPFEPIQLYSCPLASVVAGVWQESALLTEVICRYIRECSIARVIDLTAVDAYRKLVDWEEVNGSDVDVLHCFNTMAAGDYALTSFGQVLRTRLLYMSEDELIALKSEDRIENVVFRSLSVPQPGLPSELEEEMLQPWPLPSLDEVLQGGIPGRSGEDHGTQWRFAISGPFSRDVHRRRGWFERIVNAIMEICTNPMTVRGDTVKPLTGNWQGYWRYRLGDFRLVYRPDSDRRIVFCHRFGPRGGVYE